jgi:hypothetical protein
MFSKLTVALAIVAFQMASALKIQAPTNPASDGQVTIKWTADSTDPATFSIQLTNEIFHNTFAIANNVDISLGEITLTLPTLQPGSGYAVIGHDNSNINNVFGKSSEFDVGATSAEGSSTASGSASASGSGAPSAAPSTTAPVQSISQSAFGSTVKPAATSATSAAAAASSSAAPNAAGKATFNTLGAAVAMLAGGVALSI